MGSDLITYLLSFMIVQFSTKKATTKYSFGYHRAQTIGALATTFFIIIMWGILAYNAVIRIMNPVFNLNGN